MKLHNMFKKTVGKEHGTSKNTKVRNVPEGLLKKCNKCGAAILAEDAVNNNYICPKCHGYFRMHAGRRIEMIADPGTFEELDAKMKFENPLEFSGYEEKVRRLREQTGLDEAVVTGKVMIAGHPAVIGVCDGRFMMASMGEVVGEKITRAIERATKENLPVILFACSGGARMQEGIVSLMQMAKTAAALKRHSEKGLLYVSVLTDPTTGGVTASFAMLGDIILAEPNALIGFAGPRVIEQTIGKKLPKGFQRSEFLLEHGFVDRIVERSEMKSVLARILHMHDRTKEKTEESTGETEKIESTTQEDTMPKQVRSKGGISAWERVLLSRKTDRPVGTDYVNMLFSDFMEFHGDRLFRDDPAVAGGIAMFGNIPVTVIAQVKGKTTKENVTRNFAMMFPEGYRKTLRLIRQAEKFGRPVICIVDTPGAFCGQEAEEHGQGEAIASNLYELSSIKVPIVSVLIGEGGSGGALALAVADEVWILENSVYSVLSPEGFASILWKDSKRASEAAEVMKLTADDLKCLGIVEQVIREPKSYTSQTMAGVCEELKNMLSVFLKKYGSMDERQLLNHRYDRFRKM